jgi:hypothetical protein
VGIFTATLTSILVADDSELIEDWKDDVNQNFNKLSRKIDKLKTDVNNSNEG